MINKLIHRIREIQHGGGVTKSYRIHMISEKYLRMYCNIMLHGTTSVSLCVSLSLSLSLSLGLSLSLLPCPHTRTLLSPLLFITGNPPPCCISLILCINLFIIPYNHTRTLLSQPLFIIGNPPPWATRT